MAAVAEWVALVPIDCVASTAMIPALCRQAIGVPISSLTMRPCRIMVNGTFNQCGGRHFLPQLERDAN